MTVHIYILLLVLTRICYCITIIYYLLLYYANIFQIRYLMLYHLDVYEFILKKPAALAFITHKVTIQTPQFNLRIIHEHS